MDDIELPELDASLPEPDFFGPETGGVAVDTAPTQDPQPAQDLPAVCGGVALKYNDEEVEYDQFLIPVGGGGISSNTVDLMEVNGTNVDNETNGEPIERTNESGPSFQPFPDEDDQGFKPENVDKDATEDEHEINSNMSGVSSPGPNTPDSRHSSVIRLQVPKIGLALSTTSSTDGSSQTTRAKREAAKKFDIKIKRKAESDDEYLEDDAESDKEDDDDDFEPSSEEPKEEIKQTNSQQVGGRQTRSRSTRQNIQNDKSSSPSPVRKSGRTNLRIGLRKPRKAAKYGFEDDEGGDKHSGSDIEHESEDTERISGPAKKRSRKSRHWVDDDEILHYDNGNGNITVFKQSSVHVTRLTEEQITKAMSGELEDDDPDNPFLLEVCIDNIRSAEEAVKGGAKRIELCSALSEGGLTPTGGFLSCVKEKLKDTPVHVMIRPRGGDFVYSPDEIQIMMNDIRHYKQMGADGFVFGILTKDSQIDAKNCKLLRDAAYPLPCTFHRAFDLVDRPMVALEVIIELGFNYILTSGQAVTAHAGIPVIKRLVDAAKKRLTILAGAGINATNVGEIVRKTGVTEVHGSASVSVPSVMCKPGPSKPSRRGGRKPPEVRMGATDDSVIKVTDCHTVRRIVRNGKKNVKR